MLAVAISRTVQWQHFQHDPSTDKSTCHVFRRTWSALKGRKRH